MSPRELVSKLKQQHQTVLEVGIAAQQEVEQPTFDASSVLEKLRSLLAMAEEHMVLERQLFSELIEKKQAKGEDVSRLNMIIKDFEVINKLQAEIRNRFNDPQVINNDPSKFRKEFIDLCTMSKTKIDEEEESIYPEFLRICE